MSRKQALRWLFSLVGFGMCQKKLSADEQTATTAPFDAKRERKVRPPAIARVELDLDGAGKIKVNYGKESVEIDTYDLFVALRDGRHEMEAELSRLRAQLAEAEAARDAFKDVVEIVACADDEPWKKETVVYMKARAKAALAKLREEVKG